MQRIGLAVAIALAAAGAAHAAGPRAVRKQVEASMVVTGNIHVDDAGKVSGYTLDKPEKLPAAVVGLLAEHVPQWRFEPILVAGKAAHVSTEMRVRVTAKKVDEDNYLLAIRSAAFGGDNAKGGHAERAEARKALIANASAQEKACRIELNPPTYPQVAADSGVAANVYLLLKIGPNGHVQDAIAEQVNLKVVDDEKAMERWRRTFADAALRRARKWCADPPLAGDKKELDANVQVIRVPVLFNLTAPTPYGGWEAYVPGPRQANPWQDTDEGKGFSPDTLAPGQTYIAGTGLKLLTEPSGG